MAYEFLKVNEQDQVHIIELHRPASLNALNAGLLKELQRALADVDEDQTVRTVVIMGSEKAFSTGADLREAVQTNTVPDTLRLLSNLRRANYLIETLSKPVLAVIRGYCLTGGLELAMACDMRFAEENAQFGITSSRIGSVAGAGGTQRLPRLVGPSIAKDLLMSARFIDAAEAFRIGLVDRNCAIGSGLEEAMAWSRVCAQRAPLSVWLAKWAVNTGLQVDLSTALDFEMLLTTLAFRTDDRIEGMKAFLEKRAPAFQGL